MTNYTHSCTIDLSIEEALARLLPVMQEVGLGIVSDVDVQQTIKNKLDEEIPPYRILGACNPVLAKKLIEAVPQAGALLPCTLVAREENGATHVHFMAPETVLGLENHPVAEEVASDALTKIRKVIETINK